MSQNTEGQTAQKLRPAAVLVLIFEKDQELHVLFTKRSRNLGSPSQKQPSASTRISWIGSNPRAGATKPGSMQSYACIWNPIKISDQPYALISSMASCNSVIAFLMDARMVSRSFFRNFSRSESLFLLSMR